MIWKFVGEANDFMDSITFILMIVFQLAGALILLLNGICGTNEQVVKKCFPGSNIVNRDENNSCVIKKEKIQKSAREIYMNKIAFGNIVVGYGIAVFTPELTWNKWLASVVVFFLTALLITVECCVMGKISKCRYPKDIICQYQELEKNGVDTFSIDDDIDSMFS